MNKPRTRLSRFFLVGALAILGAFSGTGVASAVVTLLASNMDKFQADNLMSGSIPVLVVGASVGFFGGLTFSLFIFKNRPAHAQESIERKYIGQSGLGRIYCGMPLFVTILMMFMMGLQRLEHSIGTAATAGVCVLTLMVNAGIALYLYDRIPRSFILPIGLIGWTLLFFSSCWFAWYGPGAFGR